MVNALLQEANRISATSTEVADQLGRSAQSKRTRDVARERVEFPDPIPQKSRVVEGSRRQQQEGVRQSWAEVGAGGRGATGDVDYEEYRQATRTAAAKMVNKRSRSVDMLGAGSVSSKR